MPTQVNRRNTLYGYPNPQAGLQQEPLVMQRAPTTSDLAEPGTIWVWANGSAAWVFAGIFENSLPLWINIGGGEGQFADLIVYGETDLLGDTNIAAGPLAMTVDIGTGSGVANTINIGNTASTTTINGTLSIVPGTNTLNIGADAAANTTNISTGAAAKVLNLGSTNTTSSTAIRGGSNGISILSGTGTIGIATDATAETINVATGAGVKATTVGSTNSTSSTTVQAGTAGITLTAPFVALPGPVYIYTGAGAPSNGLALHVGDLYINTTAASASTRMYIATAASTWTNITCAA